MELAGLIVRALPRHVEGVESNLLSIPGLEVHHIDPLGRMIVTLEHDTPKSLSNSISLLQAMDKVLAVSLVYQYSEELEGPNDSEVTSESLTLKREPQHPAQNQPRTDQYRKLIK